MRLLHYNALGRLVLTDFRGKSVPPYAILSHRWSDSEILIEDISNGAYKEKEEGYQKLQFCAKQAAQDELHYFWIDTCCIDRWNNNERSKAINSMFQWYKSAARCYVFLSDVSVSTETEPIQHSHWDASFRRSEWFTRGWTLQELIAPVLVEFFSCEGHRIGDKASLDQLIHEVTSIPLLALHNCSLNEFSTSERRRWVENRKTKEEEDIVYCLLGVLGVSMITAYGEGQESAASRLQAELEEANNAPSIIPFSRNSRFVGREAQLAELQAKLFSNGQITTTLAIVGPSGTGKSQLALEIAHRTRQNNKNCSVFWIDASDEDSLYQSYANVAQKLGIVGWDDDQVDMKQLAKRCVVDISARQCLLIFDNTEDTTVLSRGLSKTEVADLTDFLPQCKLCSVIFTTTNGDTAQALASQNIIALRELTLDTALRMLQVHLARSLTKTEQQEAQHLLSELSYLPLAVVQAAACINASGMTVQEYRLQLDEHKELAHKYSNDSSESKLQGYDMRDPVAATLSLSVNQVRHNNALAIDYLFLAACIYWKDISLDLLEAASVQVREDAIRALDKYALVTRRPAKSALDLHRLVHQALRKQLQVQGELRKWTQRTITTLLHVFPNDDHSNRSKWRRLLPHVQYALSHSLTHDNGEERLDLASKCAMALYSDGRYRETEELEVQVMQTRKRVLGDEHPNTLTSMANLALTHRDQGRWTEAEQLGVQVLQARKRVLGDEHPDTLASIDNLALIYQNQGRWIEAEQLEVQVIQARKRVLGDEHPNTLNSMGNLALTYWNQGRWTEAEQLGVQVMQARKRVLGDEHPNTLISMGNLASIYQNQGRWKEGEDLEVQVIEMKQKTLGDKHPSTLLSICNLATTYNSQGRWKDAEKLGLQALDTIRIVLGNEHPHVLGGMSNLALIYSNQGRWKDAEELGVQVIEAKKRLLGNEHPDTLISISNLALNYSSQGRWKDAEELGLHVMETSKRVLGNEHPTFLTTMANLASTYRIQGRLKEAGELQATELTISLKALGKDHPSTLLSMGNLAMIRNHQGRWKEAEELEVQVMHASKRVLGDKHPITLTSMQNLASTYWNQGRLKEAEGLRVQVMQERKRVLGDEHPDTLLSVNNLASTWRAQGKWKDAEELEVRVLEVTKRVLGDEHPNTLLSMGNLGLTYSSQGRWKEAQQLEVHVIEVGKRVLGREHPFTLSTMGHLASTYIYQGQWKDAEELELRVLEVTKRVLGEEHPNTLLSMGNLALTYWNQERWTEAEELGVQVMQTRKRVLGDEHPDTITSMNNLAFTLQSQARHEEALALMEMCTRLRQQALGEQHHDTQLSLDTLHSWRMECIDKNP